MPDEIDNVLLIYMAGKANGLAGDMRKNIEDFCDGYVPEGFSRNILLTYEELTGSTGPTKGDPRGCTQRDETPFPGQGIRAADLIPRDRLASERVLQDLRQQGHSLIRWPQTGRKAI